MTNDDLDKMVELWHAMPPDDPTPLHKFLGMTWDEYEDWTRTGVVPPRVARLPRFLNAH